MESTLGPQGAVNEFSETVTNSIKKQSGPMHAWKLINNNKKIGLKVSRVDE